jgi:hypothetical protein
MFRRIELIHELGTDEYNAVIRATAHYTGVSEDEAHALVARFRKTGVMGVGNDVVFAAWGDLPMPRRAINKNCRFYFTEVGWRRYGRATIRACQQTGQRYRVLRVKEHTVAVIYRDALQVAVRPRTPRPPRAPREADGDDAAD